MKIGNIIVDKKLFMTMLIVFVIVTGLVGYSYLNSDLSFLSSLAINKYNCNQENLYDRLSCMSTPDNINSKYVSNKMGVDFSKISSDTNGKGIYTLSSTIGDTYPVHYYRGNVSDNNVKFAGFCWKIVRTTDTGGTKLLYNGAPDANGSCTATGDEVSINKTKYSYNSNLNSLTSVGYMYGDTNTSGNKALPDDTLFASSFEFADVDETVSGDGTFTLVNPTTDPISDASLLPTYHYTCLNNTGVCSEIAYVVTYDSSNSNYHYVLLKDGITIDKMIENGLKNYTDSSIKKNIDQWFENNIRTFSSYLEDTIWCNDRTIDSYGSFIQNEPLNALRFSPGKRGTSSSVSLSCTDIRDSFTVLSSTKGNGFLKYPIGLITSDELMLAGCVRWKANSDIYLNSNLSFWTNSPYIYRASSQILSFNAGGELSEGFSSWTLGVRPSISLKNDMIITSGTGIESDPYIISAPSNYQTYTLTNKVKNGSFEDGLNNWEKGQYVDANTEYNSISTNFNYFGSSSVKRIPSSLSSRNYIKQPIDFIENHKYYYFLYGYTNSPTNNPISSDIELRGSSKIVLNINKSNGWSKIGIIYPSSATETVNISVNYSATTDETYVDGVGIVDLTEAFGAGNEPDLEWCNANIDYFDGTMVVAKEN